MSVENNFKLCPLCAAACGLEVAHEARTITDIRGDQADSFSRGYICPKGVALKELDADPDRVRTPRIRRGGEWREASWEEAFAEIEENVARIIDTHGRNAFGIYIGNPAGHNIDYSTFGISLVKAMATPNIFTSNSIDGVSKHLASACMFGTPRTIPIPDLERCSHLIVLGANPLVSNGSMMVAPGVGEHLKELRSRGGKLVVIDPAVTKTAELADEHHFIRPGTDAYFLLAMVNVLFEEGLVDLGPLEQHCNGTNEVKALAKDFTPDAVAERCGIPAGEIRRITREFCVTRAAAIHARMGTCTQEFGTLASWLPDVIHVLTGNLDRTGGAMFPLPAVGGPNTKGTPGRGHPFKTGRRKSRVSGYPEVMGELPCACLAEEIDTPGEGQLRGLVTYAGNPVLSTPNGGRLARALESLEFMVSVDIYLNETTRHAHVILPGTSPLEKPHYQYSSQMAVRNVARYSPALFDPPEGDWPEWHIILRLGAVFSGRGARVHLADLEDDMLKGLIDHETRQETSPIHGGDTEAIFSALTAQRGPQRVLDLMLRTGPYGEAFGGTPDGLTLAKLEETPHGVDLGPLEPRIPEVLRTPSGKIELAPASVVADMERLKSRLSANRGALLLINRRHLRSNNSWMHNLPKLVFGKPRCTLLINEIDAEKVHLNTGDTARVTSESGALQITVEVTAGIMPGVVSIPHGWGHDVKEAQLSVANANAGVNCNVLLDARAVDVPSGNAALFGVPVEVALVQKSDRAGQASLAAAK